MRDKTPLLSTAAMGWHNEAASPIGGDPAMIFKLGDHVRYNPYLLPSRSPEWRGRTATIISIEGPYPGRGDHLFAQLQMDDDGTVRDGISTAMLVPA
jgi:hypothetical protein